MSAGKYGIAAASAEHVGRGRAQAFETPYFSTIGRTYAPPVPMAVKDYSPSFLPGTLTVEQIDDAVAGFHALERRFLPMRDLHEAASGSSRSARETSA